MSSPGSFSLKEVIWILWTACRDSCRDTLRAEQTNYTYPPVASASGSPTAPAEGKPASAPTASAAVVSAPGVSTTPAVAGAESKSEGTTPIQPAPVSEMKVVEPEVKVTEPAPEVKAPEPRRARPANPDIVLKLAEKPIAQDYTALAALAKQLGANPDLVEEYIDIVLATRQTPEVPEKDKALVTAAVNAISALNFASLLGAIEFSFANVGDWSRVRVPAANLNMAVLTSCNFDGADLSNASMTAASLYGSSFRAANLSGVALGELARFAKPYRATIHCVAYSPNGKMVAATWGTKICIWDAETGQEIRMVGDKEWYRYIAFSANNLGILGTSSTSTINLYSVETGDRDFIFGHTENVTCCAYSKDDTFFATGSEDKTVRLWDAQHGRPLGETFQMMMERSFAHEATINVIGPLESSVTRVAISPDSSLIAVGTTGRNVTVWTVKNRKLKYDLQGHTSAARYVAFSPDGKLLASGSDDKTIRLWSMKDGRCVGVLKDESVRHELKSIAFSPNGRNIAASYEKQSIRIWDVEAMSIESCIESYCDEVLSIAYSPDGTKLISSGDDFSVRVWDVSRPRCLPKLDGHLGPIHDLAFSPNGMLLASACKDRTIGLWDFRKNKLIGRLSDDSEPIMCVAFSPDGRLIAGAIGDYRAKICVWDLASRDSISVMGGDIRTVNGLAFSPDGKFLASGGDDKKVRLWDVETSACIAELEGHEDDVSAVAFSPDGSQLLSGARDKRLRVWDIATKECVQVLQDTRSVLSCIYHPDGKLAIAGNTDYGVKVWEVSTGRLVTAFNDLGGQIKRVACSSDGRRVSAITGEGKIYIWDTQRWEIMSTARIHSTSGPHVVTFANDGTTLATSQPNGLIHVWTIQPSGVLTHTHLLGPARNADVTAEFADATLDPAFEAFLKAQKHGEQPEPYKG